MPGGEFPDVVGGDTATAARQNDMQHRVVNHFFNSSQRDSLWPSPPDGAVCYLEQADELQIYSSVTVSWNTIDHRTYNQANYVIKNGDVMTGELSATKMFNTQPQNDADERFRNIAIGTAPGTALVGDIWIDTTGPAGVLNRWSGAAWIPLITGV